MFSWYLKQNSMWQFSWRSVLYGWLPYTFQVWPKWQCWWHFSLRLQGHTSKSHPLWFFNFRKFFFVEINLHKKKWLINCSYNPHKNNIGSHLNVINKTLNTYYDKYENVLGDFNAGIEETTMKSFCESYNLTNLIKQPTCFKKPRGIQFYWLNTN